MSICCVELKSAAKDGELISSHMQVMRSDVSGQLLGLRLGRLKSDCY